jgi:hypothetical protein
MARTLAQRRAEEAAAAAEELEYKILHCLLSDDEAYSELARRAGLFKAQGHESPVVANAVADIFDTALLPETSENWHKPIAHLLKWALASVEKVYRDYEMRLKASKLLPEEHRDEVEEEEDEVGEQEEGVEEEVDEVEASVDEDEDYQNEVEMGRGEDGHSTPLSGTESLASEYDVSFLEPPSFPMPGADKSSSHRYIATSDSATPVSEGNCERADRATTMTTDLDEDEEVPDGLVTWFEDDDPKSDDWEEKRIVEILKNVDQSKGTVMPAATAENPSEESTVTLGPQLPESQHNHDHPGNIQNQTTQPQLSNRHSIGSNTQQSKNKQAPRPIAPKVWNFPDTNLTTQARNTRQSKKKQVPRPIAPKVWNLPDTELTPQARNAIQGTTTDNQSPNHTPTLIVKLKIKGLSSHSKHSNPAQKTPSEHILPPKSLLVTLKVPSEFLAALENKLQLKRTTGALNWQIPPNNALSEAEVIGISRAFRASEASTSSAGFASFVGLDPRSDAPSGAAALERGRAMDASGSGVWGIVPSRSVPMITTINAPRGAAGPERVRAFEAPRSGAWHSNTGTVPSRSIPRRRPVTLCRKVVPIWKLDVLLAHPQTLPHQETSFRSPPRCTVTPQKEWIHFGEFQVL